MVKTGGGLEQVMDDRALILINLAFMGEFSGRKKHQLK